MSSKQQAQLPEWRSGIEDYGRTLSTLTLKDETELHFVCDVLSDFVTSKWSNELGKVARKPSGKRRDKALYYLQGHDADTSLLLRCLFDALGIRPSVAHGPAISTFTLEAGQSGTFVDLHRPEIDPTDRAVLDAINEGGGVVIVNDADQISGPVPHVSLDFWIDRTLKSATRKPYLCNLRVGIYRPDVPHELIVFLSPRYRSMHPAYDPLKRARGK